MLAILVAVAFQSRTDVVPAGVLPYGSSAELTQAVQKIAKATSEGDFASATALLHLIPDRKVRFQWDDEAVSKGMQLDYRTSRDKVFEEWGRATGFSDYQIVSAAPDVLVKFTSDGTLRLAWAEDPSAPRLTVTIGLQPKGQPLDPADLHNELSYAVGSYLGVARVPIEGMIMHGQEVLSGQAAGLTPLETGIARTTVTACLRIRDEVALKRKLPVGMPRLEGTFDPVKIGPILQGDDVPLEFKVKNGGDGALVYRLIPDCGCIATSGRPTTVSPGQGSAAKAEMETIDFSAMLHQGGVHKTLYLFSNDPANPVRSIPVDVSLTPRYRILPPPQVFVVDKDLDVTAYFYAPADRPLKITGASVQGLPGEVTVEPWHGEMADPDLNEPAKPRTGYKLHLKLQGVPDGSQYPAAIMIGTDDPKFPTITYLAYVQKGIVALPANVNLGEIGTASRKIKIHVVRPGKPFAIKSIQSTSKHLTASAEEVKPGEFTVIALYDGDAEKGDYLATLSIATDDPKQPLIQIPVTGTVR